MKIGIIGGSGLEMGDILQSVEEIDVETPYGEPSSKIKKGILNGIEACILSRHGLNHEITPTNVNNRANIYALAKLGCKCILATTAVGSLREEMAPGDFVVADQIIDFTKHRSTTFFDDFKKGINHASLADPFSEILRKHLIGSCNELNLKVHERGTIVTIEGPRFSTKAESFMFKNFADLINMSTAPEAVLAKEAGLEYAVVAMVTDYDCWKKTEKPVTWDEIEGVMKKNLDNVKMVLIKTISAILQDNLEKKEHIEIKEKIRTIPNFPKPGVLFRDITTLFKDPHSFKKVVDIFYRRYKDSRIDVVAGIESRGFIIGGILSEKLNCSFVPIRKKGKLPAETERQEYELEYGTEIIEIHKDAINKSQRVLLVDDLIATGGTAEASCKLIEKLGGKIVECAFIINLPDLGGKKKLSIYPVFSIVDFEGE